MDFSYSLNAALSGLELAGRRQLGDPLQYTLAPAHSRLEFCDIDKIPDSAAATGFDTYLWPAVLQRKALNTEVLHDFRCMLISKDCFRIAELPNVPLEVDGNGSPAPNAAERLIAASARDAVIRWGTGLIWLYDYASKHPAIPSAALNDR